MLTAQGDRDVGLRLDHARVRDVGDRVLEVFGGTAIEGDATVLQHAAHEVAGVEIDCRMAQAF